MSDAAANAYAALLLLDAGLVILGVVNIFTYWTNRPDKDQSFATILDSEREYRSIVWPGVVTLVTGLLVSLSASFIFVELTSGQEQFPMGSLLFAVAVIMFVVLLRPILKGEAPLEERVRYPQRIIAGAAAVSGEERDDAETVRMLETRLRVWRESAAAFSMGWVKKPASPKLNRAFGQVPGNASLGLRDACRSLWRRRAVAAAIQTAPWRFGWPLYFVVALHSVAAVFAFAGGSLVPMLVVTLIFCMISALSLFLYWSGALLVGVRRLAIGLSFLPRARSELKAASTRVAAFREHERRRLNLPSQIDGVHDALTSFRRELNRSRWVSLASVAVGGLLSVGALWMTTVSGCATSERSATVQGHRRFDVDRASVRSIAN